MVKKRVCFFSLSSIGFILLIIRISNNSNIDNKINSFLDTCKNPKLYLIDSESRLKQKKRIKKHEYFTDLNQDNNIFNRNSIIFCGYY